MSACETTTAVGVMSGRPPLFRTRIGPAAAMTNISPVEGSYAWEPLDQSWSNIQCLAALPSAETELYGVVKATPETQWFRSVLRNLGKDLANWLCSEALSSARRSESSGMWTATDFYVQRPKRTPGIPVLKRPRNRTIRRIWGRGECHWRPCSLMYLSSAGFLRTGRPGVCPKRS